MGLREISRLNMSAVEADCSGMTTANLARLPVEVGHCAEAPRNALAIRALVARHRPGLFAFVQCRVHAQVDPADIVQEIWSKALPAIETGRIRHDKAYLYGIARNLSAEAMRQHYHHSRWLMQASDEEAIADEAPSAHRIANAKDQLRALQGAVSDLPDRCREIFELRHVEQLGKAEIAHRLGISAKQVEKQLRHALSRCRRVLLSKNSLQEEGSKSGPSPTYP